MLEMEGHRTYCGCEACQGLRRKWESVGRLVKAILVAYGQRDLVDCLDDLDALAELIAPRWEK